jgi:hypothetical protein
MESNKHALPFSSASDLELGFPLFLEYYGLDSSIATATGQVLWLNCRVELEGFLHPNRKARSELASFV